MYVLLTCLYAMFMQYPMRPEEGIGSTGPGVRDATMWVLGTESQFSERAVSALTADATLQPRSPLLKIHLSLKTSLTLMLKQLDGRYPNLSGRKAMLSVLNI